MSDAEELHAFRVRQSALVAVDIGPKHGAGEEREQEDNRNHCKDGVCGHRLLQDYGKALTAADRKKI